MELSLELSCLGVQGVLRCTLVVLLLLQWGVSLGLYIACWFAWGLMSDLMFYNKI
jgi:hypothetical protein